MKKVISLILAALMLTMVLTMASCGKKTGLDAIKESGKLMVYTEAGFAPYEFYYNNEIVGVDIEIMKAVADKIGVTLEVTDVAFDSICGAIQSGKADAGAAGMTINAERQEQVDFSIPYSSTEQYVVVKEGDDSIKIVDDLNGKRIGVQEGTTSDFLIEDLIADKTLEGTVLTPYKTPAQVAAVIGSKEDALVTDKLTAQIIVENNKGLKAIALVKADGSPASEVEEYGIAVTKGNAELLAIVNEVLEDMLKSGKLDELIAKYSALATEVGA